MHYLPDPSRKTRQRFTDSDGRDSSAHYLPNAQLIHEADLCEGVVEYHPRITSLISKVERPGVSRSLGLRIIYVLPLGSAADTLGRSMGVCQEGNIRALPPATGDQETRSMQIVRNPFCHHGILYLGFTTNLRGGF